jgi:hypothetical protein
MTGTDSTVKWQRGRRPIGVAFASNTFSRFIQGKDRRQTGLSCDVDFETFSKKAQRTKAHHEAVGAMHRLAQQLQCKRVRSTEKSAVDDRMRNGPGPVS